jgi:phosphoglycolate phosphatase
MNYSSLVFDLDGTISDPATGIIRCVNHALAEHGFPTRRDDEITPHIGPPLEDTLSLLSGVDDPQYIDELVASYRERYLEVGFAENELYEGIRETLAELEEQDYRMGVCTSKYEKSAIKVLARFDLLGHFDYVSGGDVGIRKGNQLGALLQEGRIDREALMIGDRNMDLIAANENGLPSCGVLWGYGDLDELRMEGPEHIISHPSELLQCV